jgi:hypothetical protein
LPLVEALYECQRNPFLNSKNEVDLTGGGNDTSNSTSTTTSGGGGGGGGGMVMCADTPVAFSLPSAPPGEVDASGLCTLMILRRLERAHNMLVERFSEAKRSMLLESSSSSTMGRVNKEEGVYALQPLSSTQNDASATAGATAVNAPPPTAPAISYLTLPSLCKKSLLSYDRDQLPAILARCSKQPLGDTQGNLGFDFDGKLLEDELSKLLR